MPDLAAIAGHFSRAGLVLRGGFRFDAATPAPEGLDNATSVLLVGNAGAAHWPTFAAWRARQPADISNPLDTWTKHVVLPIATRFGARAVFPSDRPYVPFQRWAMRAEGLRPSPLGILIHPTHGLWHAYRAALVFNVDLSIQEPAEVIHLCDLCDGKPCLNPCPVDAHSPAGFAYRNCVDHVSGSQGSPCRERGCLDRNACPYGTEYRYPTHVQSFHMAAFTEAAR